MFKNNIIFFVILTFLLMSCGTLQSVKRGITGEKDFSTDEFLVQKKDPLILPPDFENLPTPSERQTAQDESSKFEKTLTKSSSTESISSSSSSSGSTEQSILEKIRNQ